MSDSESLKKSWGQSPELESLFLPINQLSRTHLLRNAFCNDSSIDFSLHLEEAVDALAVRDQTSLKFKRGSVTRSVSVYGGFKQEFRMNRHLISETHRKTSRYGIPSEESVRLFFPFHEDEVSRVNVVC